MRTRQLCCLHTFSCGEDLFQHISQANDYGILVRLGLMHYLSVLYEEEIMTPKKRKRVSVLS